LLRGGCDSPVNVAAFGGLPLGPQLLSIGSPSNWTFLPSIFTSSAPGPTNFVMPWVFADTKPPPVALEATSPMLLNVAPLIATALPSILTFFE
jgi:hypothetical protein